MTSKEVSLETARFLDSSAARQLDGPRRETLRAIAEAFFAGCYGGVGKKPRLLEDHELLEVAGVHMPSQLQRSELTDHVHVVLPALLDHLEEDQVVPHAFELRRALDEATARFELSCRERPQVARKGSGTVEHRAAKLGRNDPCFCGSGRKFKKCCGKPQG